MPPQCRHARELPERISVDWTPKLLIVSGPYRLTRNPMYVAELGMWLGWAVFFGSVLLVLALGFNAVVGAAGVLATRSMAGVVDGIGGGPILVRDGKPVFRHYELFSTHQLARNPRTAVGQRADGRILLVVVDGTNYAVGGPALLRELDATVPNGLRDRAEARFARRAPAARQRRRRCTCAGR